MNVPEAELVELRNRIAAIYGEDVAQETVVRVLSKDYKKRWFEFELIDARRRWFLHQAKENRHVEMTEVLQPHYKEENRLEARHELRRIAKTKVGYRLIDSIWNKKPLHSMLVRRARHELKNR